MTISEAMRKVSDEYNAECVRGRSDRAFAALMSKLTIEDFLEIDEELPGIVAQIAKCEGVKNGTILPDYVYLAARLCFRFGMRVQRKLDQPREVTTMFHSGERHD